MIAMLWSNLYQTNGGFSGISGQGEVYNYVEMDYISLVNSEL